MKPQLPLGLRNGGDGLGNVVEAGGCRIAHFGNDTDAAKAILAVAYVQSMGDTDTITFDAAIAASLLMGELKASSAILYAGDDTPLLRATYEAIQSHLKAEVGDNPFNVFKPEDEEYE